MAEKIEEKWMLQELVDEAVAMGQIRPEQLNEYIYEFKQGGREIQDLTAASYDYYALEHDITTVDTKREDLFTDGVIFTYQSA